MIVPVVMYRCENWAIKKVEHQRIDAFKLWCWRRLLRVLWTERRSNQSIQWKSTLTIHWKDWCWSWNSIPLATDMKSWLIGKVSDAGRDWRQKDKGALKDEMVGWHHWLGGHEFEQIPVDSEGQRSLGCCCPWGSQRIGHDLATEQQKQQLKHFIHVSRWAVFHLEIRLFLRFSPPAPGNLSRGHWCQHFLSHWHVGGGCAGRCGRWKGDGKWKVLAVRCTRETWWMGVHNGTPGSEPGSSAVTRVILQAEWNLIIF